MDLLNLDFWRATAFLGRTFLLASLSKTFWVKIKRSLALAASFSEIASSTFLTMVLIDALWELFKELREFACLDLFLADWIFAIGSDDEDLSSYCQH